MGNPQTNPSHVADEIAAICNSLGKVDENDGTYMKDRDCKICLKEIVRLLNADSDLRAARIALGEINIIKSDLIPLMVQYCDDDDGDSDLFNLILRICTNLTAAALLLFEHEEVPTDPDDLKLYNRLLKCLYGYKEAFASNEKIWILLNTYLKNGMKDEVVFERLIILIRNILHIPVDSTADMGCHSEFDTHDMCLFRMDKSGMLDTLIYICSETEKGSEYCFHLMEIIYLMLRNQNPETIAKARPFTLKRKLDDDDADKKRLAELSARDRRDREASKLNAMQVRFRNTLFQARNYRSLTEAPLLVRKPLCSSETIKFDAGKVQLRKARNRKPLSSETTMMISDMNKHNSKVAHSLKVFCQRFVEQIYNNYMQQIKHNLIQKKTQDNDESYYLWALQFFTSFSRHMNIPLENISETISASTLHYIQIMINTYQEKLKMEKKKFSDVSQRLHLAVRAYREILGLIKSIEPNSDFSRTTEIMQRNVFTETEYCTLLLTLFQSYEEHKHSSHYLTDLILTNDIFLELLEEYSRTHSAVILDDATREDEDKEDPEDPEEEAQLERADGEQLLKKPAQKKRLKKKKSIEFRTAHFMIRYCCPVVISSYMEVLRSFRTNDTNINMAILKFLERIVFDCKNQVILLQASVIKCLLDIMSYHSTMPGKERFDCLTQTLAKTFGVMANKKRWMYQELLFWKSGTDVIEIENAIDPPPPVLAEHRDLPDDDDGGGGEEKAASELEEQPETERAHDESLAALMAELHDSSDDDDVNYNQSKSVDAGESEPQGQASSENQPDESVAYLLAELGSDQESNFDEILPELSDDENIHDDNSICAQSERGDDDDDEPF